MRPVFAALLVCLFAVMVTADRVLCPDGCTDEAPAQSTSLAPSSCALCHGWNQALALVAWNPLPHRLARQHLFVASPAQPTLSPVERPPKAA